MINLTSPILLYIIATIIAILIIILKSRKFRSNNTQQNYNNEIERLSNMQAPLRTAKDYKSQTLENQNSFSSINQNQNPQTKTTISEFAGSAQFSWDGKILSNYAGHPVARFDGKQIFNFAGSPIFTWEHNCLSKFAGKKLYTVSNRTISEYAGAKLFNFNNQGISVFAGKKIYSFNGGVELPEAIVVVIAGKLV